jgi:hypothetical protein
MLCDNTSGENVHERRGRADLEAVVVFEGYSGEPSKFVHIHRSCESSPSYEGK